jgi:hypothetical protein
VSLRTEGLLSSEIEYHSVALQVPGTSRHFYFLTDNPESAAKRLTTKRGAAVAANIAKLPGAIA